MIFDVMIVLTVPVVVGLEVAYYFRQLSATFVITCDAHALSGSSQYRVCKSPVDGVRSFNSTPNPSVKFGSSANHPSRDHSDPDVRISSTVLHARHLV